MVAGRATGHWPCQRPAGKVAGNGLSLRASGAMSGSVNLELTTGVDREQVG